MKELYSRWCDVGSRTIFRLKVFKKTDEELVGEFNKIENYYMNQRSIDTSSSQSVGPVEEITGSDLENVFEKAKLRIQELGYTFSRWRKENG